MTTEKLNVLVLESERGVGDVARHDLVAAGHNIVGCHEPGEPGFPCNALIEGRSCPLDTEVVDVALLVRGRVGALPRPREEGARCAVVHRIPLVVAGHVLLNPFESFATGVVEEHSDVVDACERAAHASLRHHVEAAEKVLREVLDRRGLEDVYPAVDVVRRRGCLLIRVTGGGDLDHTTKNVASARMLGAVRAVDRYARGIDVTFEEP
jgi:hypothetical protein